MFELRWLIKAHPIPNPNLAHDFIHPKVLQYRAALETDRDTGSGGLVVIWSEWQDVPEVTVRD